ncbi:MAG TPA: hypothetical protein VKK81_14645, partial [Candidatus Binatia bacterium]|nr:hypothetical protein [Candidatus Binatia bacterium]
MRSAPLGGSGAARLPTTTEVLAALGIKQPPHFPFTPRGSTVSLLGDAVLSISAEVCGASHATTQPLESLGICADESRPGY